MKALDKNKKLKHDAFMNVVLSQENLDFYENSFG
tara:strand:- start:161 stop:262 length:102 start_codon:yes stop_codon:yes gene_type:complete